MLASYSSPQRFGASAYAFFHLGSSQIYPKSGVSSLHAVDGQRAKGMRADRGVLRIDAHRVMIDNFLPCSACNQWDMTRRFGLTGDLSCDSGDRQSPVPALRQMLRRAQGPVH